MKKVLLILILFLLSGEIKAQRGDITREEYIELYKDIAISEMQRTGIPASIKLSQGMIETGNGNSRLALKSNNHFGIKCHKTWEGKKIYHDDDDIGECFRKYKNPDESFRDHSDFLTGSARYSFLFELEKTDYKGWAYGLKSAGYATSPTYASALIKIIEDNELYRFDMIALTEKTDIENMKASSAGRQVYQKNRVKYIITTEDDTFDKLQKETKIRLSKLLNYNDIENPDFFNPGMVLYLQPKRNQAEAGKRNHIVKDGETMHAISQEYAIKLSQLYKKNLMEFGSEPKPGQELSLRKQMKGNKPARIKEKPTRQKKDKKILEDRDKIEFEFNE